MEHYTYLIEDAEIIDGSSNERYHADVGICGDRIAAIGNLSRAVAEHRIKAAGRVLTPGFIDSHSHADCTLLFCPSAESALMQGITTVVTGNCGLSPAPLTTQWVAQFWEYDIWDALAPEPFSLFGGKVIQPAQKVRDLLREKLGVSVEWENFHDFLEALKNRHIGINIAPLVGHGQIRANVMDEDCRRAATATEMDAMLGHLREAMESGAFGFSSGLSYTPGVFSDAAELTRFAKETTRYGGLYATHFNRIDLVTGKPQYMGGILEALNIGRATGIPIEISHIYTCDLPRENATAQEVEDAARRTLYALEAAQQDGVDAGFDIIPNVDGGVAHMLHLYTLLHGWILEAGDMESFRKLLGNNNYCSTIRRKIEAREWFMIDPVGDPRWADHVVLMGGAGDYQGKTLSQIALLLGADPLDALFELLRRYPDPLMRQITPELREEAVRVFIDHPMATIGSDSFALSGDGLYGNRQPVFAVAHPNTYGAFIRYLTEYPQQRMEDTIRKITGLPADRFGIAGRGYIKEGYAADLVLLDTNKLDSRMDYCDPPKVPVGVDMVFVNGRLAVENGQMTETRNGKILRKNQTN